MSKPVITGTTHALPFDRLSPRDFERLCLWLVEREGYERAEHLGAAGSEQGRDVIAWLRGELWAFQCKRVQRFGPAQALIEVEKVLALPKDERPAGLAFLVTCDVSASTRQRVRKRCVVEGMRCEFWAGAELDEKVKRHSDLLREFFSTPALLPGRVAIALLVVALTGVVVGSYVLSQRRSSCGYPAGWVDYTVQQGDTIWDLATAHRIPPKALSNANCLASDLLEPGQVIYIPLSESEWQNCGTVPDDWIQITVEPGRTLHYLALGYGINFYELAYVNCLDLGVHEGQVIWVPPSPFDVAARLRALEPSGVLTYEVQVGDTIQAIASYFELQPETIVWANDVVNDFPYLLRIGQELVIPPVDGVYHLVEDGETVESIAAQYYVEASAITDLPENQFVGPGFTLVPGQHLVVPGAERPYVPKRVAAYTGIIPEGAQGTGRFQWPALGRITQGYWYGHRAVDIGSPPNSVVLAADKGFVSFAGWTDVGYGNLIVIDHVNGFATYYAHLNDVFVSRGEVVERGQIVGAVGATGFSTGPHLHFELRKDGVQLNPRDYLP